MFNTIIHTILKDESHILNEWIIHHILLGIKHIFIYDDQSDIPANTTINILPDWIKSKVTVFQLENNIDFYNKDSFKNSSFYNPSIYEKYFKIKQLYFQNYFLQSFKSVADWCLFCNVDEFIYLKDDTTINSILEKYQPYDIIFIPWLIYGSSYHIEQPTGLVIDKFRMHDKNYFFKGKSFCKMNNITEISCQYRINNYNIFCFDYNSPLYTLPIHINHYQINSVKLYIQRKLRTEISIEYGNSKLPSEIFTFIKNFNNIDSNIMDKYIVNINNILQQPLSQNKIINKDLYPYFFMVNDEFIHESVDYNNLLKILNNSNVKYFSLSTDLPKNFDAKIYKILNKDLCSMHDADIYKHYMIHGKLENRIYSYSFPENFSIDAYKNLNSDLEHLNIDELYNHFISIGVNENRLYKYDLPNNFNVNYYRILNHDISNLTDYELYKHYTLCGKYENRKYNYLSNDIIIFTIIKDEEHILNEWIVHHILIGFNNIYIYDDQSAIPISETIKILPEWIKDRVTVYRFEDNIDFYNRESFKNSIFFNDTLYSKYYKLKQLYFQNYFLQNFKSAADWCLFCDVDEFIYLNNIKINDIIDQYNSYDIIYIPWLIYGSSFHIEQPKGLVIDNFRMHDTNYFHLGKSICKINKINEITCIHKINTLYKTFVFDNNSSLYTLPIHINHYQINSVKLYIKRKLRKEIGWENGITRPPEEIFTFIKYFNNIYSDIMNKYIDGINKILKNDILNTRNDEAINKYLHPYFLINNDKFIYTFTTNEDLYSILESTNVKYFSIKDDLPEGFSARIYRLLNNDLNGMSDADIYKHYIIHGKEENRVYSYSFPENFNLGAYKNLNTDLENFSEEELCEHYIVAGINENRLYKYYIPDNFNIDKYRNLNNDLCNLTDNELYKHFTLLGQFENRVYNDNISPVITEVNSPVSSHAVSSHAVSTIAVPSMPVSSMPVSSNDVSSNAVSSNAVSNHDVSSNAVSSNAVSSHAVPSHAVSSHAVSSHAVSSNDVSSHAVSSHAVSSHAVSSHAVSSMPVSSQDVSSNAVSSHAVSSQDVSTKNITQNSSIIDSEKTIINQNKIETYNNSINNNNYSIPPSPSQMVNNTSYSNRGRNNSFHIDNIINNIISTRSNMISNIINRDNPNAKINKIPINISPVNIKK